MWESESDCIHGVEFVFFDLETTGFGRDEEIIQITACTKDTGFIVYITPTKPIHPKATEVNGFTLNGNQLFLHGQRVDSVPAACAFQQFLEYLQDLYYDIVLIAHNCFAFDMPKLVDLFEVAGSPENFLYTVNCYSDSLVLLKNILKDKRAGKGSFTLEALAQDYLGECLGLNKAELLQELFFNSALDPISGEEIMEVTKTTRQYIARKDSKRAKAKANLHYYSNIVPKWVIDKMAQAIIDDDLLRKTYEEGGCEGIKRLLSENYYGKPRITRNKYIIRNICRFLED